jgi:hypothetical protein
MKSRNEEKERWIRSVKRLFHSNPFSNIKYSPNSSELLGLPITVRFPVVVLAKPWGAYVRSLVLTHEIEQYEKC